MCGCRGRRGRSRRGPPRPSAVAGTYALLDWRVPEEKPFPIPSRVQRHVKQSRFEDLIDEAGELLRVLLAHKDEVGTEFETNFWELAELGSQRRAKALSE